METWTPPVAPPSVITTAGNSTLLLSRRKAKLLEVENLRSSRCLVRTGRSCRLVRRTTAGKTPPSPTSVTTTRNDLIMDALRPGASAGLGFSPSPSSPVAVPSSVAAAPEAHTTPTELSAPLAPCLRISPIFSSVHLKFHFGIPRGLGSFFLAFLGPADLGRGSSRRKACPASWRCRAPCPLPARFASGLRKPCGPKAHAHPPPLCSHAGHLPPSSATHRVRAFVVYRLLACSSLFSLLPLLLSSSSN